MDALEEKWKHFRLSEEEEESIVVDEELLAVSLRKGERSLVGKLCSDRVVNKDVIHNTMSKI